MPAHLETLLAILPRLPLTRLPSPVAPLPALSRDLGIAVYLKNDGVCSDLYAGNKVRKLEFLLAAAQHKQARHVVTLGAAGSNHAVATSTYAQQLGMDCTICMTHQPVAPVVTGNLRRHLHLGTRLEIYERYSLAVARAQELAESPATYLIPLGGSSPCAIPGFIAAAAELARQIDAGDIPMPHRVYVACGTMGTAAGLVLGFAILRLPIQVVAVRVTDPAIASPTLFRRLYSNSVEYLNSFTAGKNLDVDKYATDAQLLFCEDHIGAGYGVPTPGALLAIDAALADHLTLDPTYTGKAMAALIEHARSGQLQQQNVLFWNTLNANETPQANAAEGIQPSADFARYFPAG